MLACVVAEVTLTASLIMLASDRHVRVPELIADGRGEVPVRAVQRERRRLTAPSHRAQLAHSLH